MAQTYIYTLENEHTKALTEWKTTEIRYIGNMIYFDEIEDWFKVIDKRREELTELEQKVMKCFILDNFYENGLDSILWTDCFIDTIEGYSKIDTHQSRGVLSSLKKKGYLYIDGGKDSGTSLTEIGKAWLIDNSIIDENGKYIKSEKEMKEELIR